MFDPFFGPEAQYLCAAIAAALSSLAFFPYITDTLAGRTQPQRSSWLIWSVLSAISLASQWAEGAEASLLYAAIQCGGSVFIFCLATTRGVGTYAQGKDAAALFLAGCGLGLWLGTDNGAYALLISCAISLTAGVVTMAKALARPESETFAKWVIALLAACFALGSVGQIDPVLMIYPAYLFVLSAGVVLSILTGRLRARVLAEAA